MEMPTMRPAVLFPTIILVFVAALAGGCAAPAVGDPCTPEAIPMGGFVGSEAYLETSSVQCRTRVCMVYRLDGDPTCVGAPPCAASEDAVNDRVYCTCRCGVPSDVTGDPTLCECPEGYECTEVLDLGGNGIRGSYCVKGSTVDTEG
jgi:hypothetical protein